MWLIAFSIAVVAILGVLVATVKIRGGDQIRELFFMVIGGVMVLLILIAVVATVFSLLGLANRKQAMALPEGSMRAVIALSVLVLFAILTIFLYDSLRNTESGTVQHLSKAEALAFVDGHPNLPNLKMELEHAKPDATPAGAAATQLQAGSNNAPPAPKAPNAANNPGPAPAPAPAPKTPNAADNAAAGAAPKAPAEDLYTVSYGGSTTADDFAKQLMTLLGTLVTAVVSFYFGAKTATSAAAATAEQASAAVQAAAGGKPSMTLASVDPPAYSGAPKMLTILGANLNSVVHARIERGAGAPVQLDGVHSNATQVTGQVAVTPAMIGGAPWNVVVDDGAGNTARLDGKLTLAAAGAPAAQADTSLSLTGVTSPYSGAPNILTIQGANLGSVVKARIERTSSPSVQLGGLHSTASQVTGQISVTDDMVGGAPWDVIVEDGAGKTAHLDGKLALSKAT